MSPETHLVKHRESQSRTNESQFKKKKKIENLKLKMFRPIFGQTDKRHSFVTRNED